MIARAVRWMSESTAFTITFRSAQRATYAKEYSEASTLKYERTVYAVPSASKIGRSASVALASRCSRWWASSWASVLALPSAERVLVPALEPGQIVVMDNLGAHRPRRVRELIEARGCELLYLPAYSPDLNPIEEAFSKVKHILRKIGARRKEELIEAMGRALRAVGAQDVGGFFAHCGYRTPAQQP